MSTAEENIALLARFLYVDNGRLSGHWQITDRLGVFMQLRQGLASA